MYFNNSSNDIKDLITNECSKCVFHNNIEHKCRCGRTEKKLDSSVKGCDKGVKLGKPVRL